MYYSCRLIELKGSAREWECSESLTSLFLFPSWILSNWWRGRRKGTEERGRERVVKKEAKKRGKKEIYWYTVCESSSLGCTERVSACLVKERPRKRNASVQVQWIQVYQCIAIYRSETLTHRHTDTHTRPSRDKWHAFFVLNGERPPERVLKTRLHFRESSKQGVKVERGINTLTWEGEGVRGVLHTACQRLHERDWEKDKAAIALLRDIAC